MAVPTLHNKIDSLTEKVDNVLLVVQELSSMLQIIQHDLYGNGKQGLVGRIENLESETRNYPEHQRKLEEIRQEVKGINKKVAYFSGIGATIVFAINKFFGGN